MTICPNQTIIEFVEKLRNQRKGQTYNHGDVTVYFKVSVYVDLPIVGPTFTMIFQMINTAARSKDIVHLKET